jgi:hypothetical protein
MLTANSGDKSRSLVNKVSLVGGVREIWINIELLEGFEVEGRVGSTWMGTCSHSAGPGPMRAENDTGVDYSEDVA